MGSEVHIMPGMAAYSWQFLLAVFVTIITMVPVTVDAGRIAPDAAEMPRPFMHVRADGSTPGWVQNADPVCEGPTCQLVVRVSGRDITAARKALMSTGVKCLQYVPHDAFIGLFSAPVLPDQLFQLEGVESSNILAHTARGYILCTIETTGCIVQPLHHDYHQGIQRCCTKSTGRDVDLSFEWRRRNRGRRRYRLGSALVHYSRVGFKTVLTMLFCRFGLL